MENYVHMALCFFLAWSIIWLVEKTESIRSEVLKYGTNDLVMLTIGVVIGPIGALLYIPADYIVEVFNGIL